jgi:hypothetical protein
MAGSGLGVAVLFQAIVYGAVFAIPALMVTFLRTSELRAMGAAAGLGMSSAIALAGLLSGFIVVLLPAIALWVGTLLLARPPNGGGMAIAAGLMWGFGLAGLPALVSVVT